MSCSGFYSEAAGIPDSSGQRRPRGPLRCLVRGGNARSRGPLLGIQGHSRVLSDSGGRRRIWCPVRGRSARSCGPLLGTGAIWDNGGPRCLVQGEACGAGGALSLALGFLPRMRWGVPCPSWIPPSRELAPPPAPVLSPDRVSGSRFNGACQVLRSRVAARTPGRYPCVLLRGRGGRSYPVPEWRAQARKHGYVRSSCLRTPAGVGGAVVGRLPCASSTTHCLAGRSS